MLGHLAKLVAPIATHPMVHNVTGGCKFDRCRLDGRIAIQASEFAALHMSARGTSRRSLRRTLVKVAIDGQRTRRRERQHAARVFVGLNEARCVTVR
jgi:hypothetical protein